MDTKQDLSVIVEILPLTHYLNGVKMGDSSANVALAGQRFNALRNDHAVWIDIPGGRACYFGLGEEGTSFKFIRP